MHRGGEAAQRERFERVWREHRPRLARLTARLAGDADLADDLLQEVCLRAFAGFAGFRRESGAYTWLYRITVNVVLLWRERRQHETVSLGISEASFLIAPGAGPEALALQSALRPAVWTALDHLPEDQRATLILQLYEGLKYREVALVLGVPLGTVKSRINAAMQRLREELKDYAM